ncbi:MAG TPA: hypothetical protein VFZ69_11535 [Longimicrobiales bacterium]
MARCVVAASHAGADPQRERTASWRRRKAASSRSVSSVMQRDAEVHAYA